MTSICLVAGGTGGHIFPAIAFAEWIKMNVKEVSVSFVCGARPLEREIYGESGIEPLILPLDGSPFGTAGLSKRFGRAWRIVLSYHAFRAFLRRNSPDICVLFGGYVSFIPLLVSHLRRIPVVIHEQNAVAGKITRLASSLRKPVAAGWSECRPLSPGKFIRTGIPVRPFSRIPRHEAWKSMGLGELPPNRTVVGVLGGSLLSPRLVQLVGDVVTDRDFADVSFLFIGEKSLSDPSKEPECASEALFYVKRQSDMSSFFSVVDLVVTRGGASTLAELAALGIPAVVVPWLGAAGNHQELNARLFTGQNDGEVWLEGDPPVALKRSMLNLLGVARKSVRSVKKVGDESESLWRLISSSIGREIV